MGSVLEGRYLVLRRIARGGTAAVYEGLDQRLDRPVALKLMHPHLADDPRFAARAQREARAAARIHHPNVVAVLDQGLTEDGVLYLVLEYVAGPTLREVVRRESPMGPAAALDLLVPVLRGLAQAHRNGLVHRDVKPENVLLTPDGDVKVADFGLTRAVEEHTATTTVLGTVGYAAPELVGDGPVDQRSDVYAVGIMAYEMLTGARPYTGTALQIVNAHVSRDVPAPSGAVPGIPPALDEFVLRATARDASRRPVDAAALLDLALAIRRSLAEEPFDPPSLRGAPTEVVPLPQGSHGSAAPTEVIQQHGTPATGDAASTVPLGTVGAQRPCGDAPPRDGASPGEEGRRQRILPPADVETSGGLATTRVGSSARPAPTEPQVKLNPQPDPLHVAAACAVFALMLAAAAFLGWWLGSAPGTRTATVPSLAGQETAAAERALDAAGISNVGVRTTTSRDVPAGTVVSTDPAASTTVRSIEQVNLLVSSGPARVEVPSVTGMSDDDARRAVDGAGLETGDVDQQYSPDSEGTVLSQSPAAGTTVDEGSRVGLTVAVNTPQGPPPNVVGQDVESARAALEERGYTVTVDSPLGSHLHRVVRQQEDAGTVTLTVL